MKTKKKRFYRDICVVFILLIALCAGLIVVRLRKEKTEPSVQHDTSMAETDREIIQLPEDNDADAIVSDVSDTETASDIEVGTLIESGSDLNKNFFANGEYFGTASDLTDTSFYMGKAGMAFDAQTRPLMSPIKINYSGDVEVREAILYNNDDKYELYASSISDFEAKMNEKGFFANVLVSLDDTSDDELYANVITFFTYADLG